MNGDNLPRGSTPVPDPTVLTTQQLSLGLAALREILETRLDAMDTATELNKQATDKIPLMIKSAVDSLKELHDERFSGVEKQFKERDTRTEQSSKDSKVAVDAALQAAKEAVGEQNKSSALAIAKSEASTNKQLEALDEKINDIKGRLDRGEGGSTQEHESRGQSNWLIGAVLSGIAIIVAFGALVVHFVK